MPVPPPAVAELMRGLPVYGSDRSVGRAPDADRRRAARRVGGRVRGAADAGRLGVGYGLGRKEIAGRPNAVRLISGTAWPGGRQAGGPNAEVLVVECEVDDLSGEGLGHATTRLLAEGALDVYPHSGADEERPAGESGVDALPPPGPRASCGALLAETGSLGCRFQTSGRFEAEREIVTVQTRFGEVRVKRARFLGRTIANAPEFEDCKRLAEVAGTTWRAVHEAAMVVAAAWFFFLVRSFS